jgi:glycosyltransferase involved in cell wall biosynthesis
MGDRQPFTILIFNHSWARPREMALPRCPAGCQFTRDRARMQEADAVLFHVPSMADWSGIHKLPGQKWVATSMESDVLYPQLRDPAFMGRFDLTHTYRRDSDVPIFYFGPDEVDWLRRPVRPKSARAPVAAFISNVWDASGRYRYMSELMRHLEVDSFGKVLRNRTLSEDHGRQTKLDVIATYKFTIAIENSRALDYVTEKLYDPLIAGSVPVYLGAPNVEDFAPADHCYVHAADFNGPRELADFLTGLATDQARYDAYLAWKHQPLRSRWLDLAMSQQGDPLCRLCAMLRARHATSPALYVVRPRGDVPALTVAAVGAGHTDARLASGFIHELIRQGVDVQDEAVAGARGNAAPVLHFGAPDQVVPRDGRLTINYTMFGATPVPELLLCHSRTHELVIVPTEFSKGAWMAGGFPQASIRVCPPGVDLEMFRPDAPPLPLTAPGNRSLASFRRRILCVSEIRDARNLLGLLRVWIRHTDRADDAILVLKLIGDCSARSTAFMFRLHMMQRALGRTLAQAAPVLFHDAVLLDAQLPRLYAAATHYWSMSRGEGWDLSAVDAAACGLRLIVPDHSSYADWLDASTATLIPCRQVPVTVGADDPVARLVAPAVPAAVSSDGGTSVVHWWEPDEDAAGRIIAAAVRSTDQASVSLRGRLEAEFTWALAGRRLLAALKDLQLDHGR